MKKTKLIFSALILSMLMAAGVLFGCAQPEQEQTTTQTPVSDYEKLLQANTIENLAGENGTLACTIETYENSELDDTMAIQWTTTNGTPSLKWTDTMGDTTQYAVSEYTSDSNCGGIYSLESGEKYAALFPQGDFSTDIVDEWNNMIDYEGTQSDVVEDENIATLEVTHEAQDGEASYYKAIYTFDPETYVLSSLEVTDYDAESNEVLDKIIIKDVSTSATLDLPENPYEQIIGADDSQSCNLTVVVNQLDGQQVTSTYKVSRDTEVELMIAEDFEMYSDEAMTTLIEDEEIDVNRENATVYVQIKESTNEEMGTGLSDDGTEYVTKDGTVLHLGEDAQWYDEAGNVVQLEDIEATAEADTEE